MNLMQVRSIAIEVVKVQMKRIGKAEEEVLSKDVDDMHMYILEILARKKEIMSILSAGRGEYPSIK